MIYLNRIEVIGNLTKDVELRYTPSNQAVASFSLATNRRYKDQTGNWVDSPPEYHEIIMWGNMGERCNQLLHKGDRVFVTGRLQTRSWEAPDGSKRYKTEVVADTVLGPDQISKGGGGGNGSEYGNYNQEPSAAPAPAASSRPAKKPAGNPEEEINIEDIPF